MQRHQQCHRVTPLHYFSPSQVLVVMGAFACKDHFGSAARHLADNGYEVTHNNSPGSC